MAINNSKQSRRDEDMEETMEGLLCPYPTCTGRLEKEGSNSTSLRCSKCFILVHNEEEWRSLSKEYAQEIQRKSLESWVERVIESKHK